MLQRPSSPLARAERDVRPRRVGARRAAPPAAHPPTRRRGGHPAASHLEQPGLSTSAIDGHQHFWNPERVPLPWLRPEHAAVAGRFEPPELEPHLRAAGIERTVLVQAVGSDDDTDYMLEHAARHDWIGGVVAWAA